MFERDGARTFKKVARYQQFGAVNKAIERTAASSTPKRGGVVWHTQGSGKTLTMLWLALKLRRPAAENPTLVIVTDRNDLDEQITETFRAAASRTRTRPESVRDLRELLARAAGRR